MKPNTELRLLPSISTMWTIWFPRSCPFPVFVRLFLLLLILLLLLLVCVPFIYSESLELGTPTPQKLLNGVFFFPRNYSLTTCMIRTTPSLWEPMIPVMSHTNQNLKVTMAAHRRRVHGLNSLSAISGPKLVGTCPSEV